ncbi:MAG TPA: isoprenylcysteine carboxylmethyltransferase family protein [Vicinamibacterales bacterium]|nr:isoprenylcysteine carboxylmethyltransferase family protein [Vicinamibacterales bacterium]
MTPAAVMLVALSVAVVVQRLAELRLATRNARWARAEGAVEHGAGHYPAFVVLHTAWLAGWIAEGWTRGPSLTPAWPLWLAGFVFAEGLRYWAIAALGRRWNTRILVIPGRPLVSSGPYRLLSHPNYVAVAIELVSVPMVFGAWLTAAIATMANAALLLFVRIPAEERALRASAPSRT